MALSTFLAINLGAVTLVMIMVWLWSLRIRDASIVDIAWGANGALIGLITFFLASGAPPRQLLISAMAVFWGVRLTLYIGVRKWGKGEDFRYAAMRENHGTAFPRRSLVRIFLFQAILIWAISMPVMMGATAQSPSGLTFLDGLGVFLFILGFVIEVVADQQLKAFLSRPENKNQVLDQGLWRYSRHPNYFGESLIWWGIFLSAASTPWGWVTIFSPLLMTYFLLEVSGVPLLEEALAERREGYRDYMARTSKFVPWPPGKAPTPGH